MDETVTLHLKSSIAAILRLAGATVSALLLGTAIPGWSQDAPPEPAAAPSAPIVTGDALYARYPAGSIASVAAANAALDDTARERTRINAELIRQQRVCYQKFFVSSCLNKVAEVHRGESKKLKNIEIEANTYLRQDRADERDAALAEQRAKDLADAPRRAEEQRKNAQESARKIQESAQRSAEAEARAQQVNPSPDQRIADHEKKMQQARAQQEAVARAHDANVAAYNKKVKDAQDRQKEVADKKAQKAADLAAKKAADQAAQNPPAQK